MDVDGDHLQTWSTRGSVPGELYSCRSTAQVRRLASASSPRESLMVLSELVTRCLLLVSGDEHCLALALLLPLSGMPYARCLALQNSACLLFRKAPDTFNFLRHVMRAILSVRPKCSHRCVSLKETPLKPVQILKHTTKSSAEQTSMRTKWFKHIAL